MRPGVEKLLELGIIPSETEDASTISKFEMAIAEISAPLENEEAKALLGCFGEDECFGLSWQLVHLIETSPQPYPEDDPGPKANYWLRLLFQRYQNNACHEDP